MNVLPSPVHIVGRLLDSVDLTAYRALRSGSVASPQVFSGRLFDVDPDTGFFPPQPLQKLGEEFAIWEDALVEAQQVLKLGEDRGMEAHEKCAKGEQWRQRVRSWSILDIRALGDKTRVLRRAHYVLACLLHFYVHSLPVDVQTVIPRPLAVPLVAVSDKIKLPPVLTFADIVLWNWEFIDPEQPLSLLSAAAELRGVEMLRIIERVLNMPCHTDRNGIAAMTREFEQLVKVIEDITVILKNASQNITPNVFYWEVRPWWNGSNAAAPWIFDGVPVNRSFDLGGASAGQSSVMHALDIFLGVDHALKEARQPAPSAENRRADTGFMEKMRRYMPVEHREYLAQLQKRNIREIVQGSPALREPYNKAVDALKRFRTAHIQIGTLFIISQARSTPPESMGQLAVSPQANEGHSKGTGGNPVSTLLKAGRDATHRTILRGD